jgi:hypothetical protein
MTSGFFRGDILRGLAVRVLFFLSLALFPIGLIAISQTQQISEQNRINAELSLLAITEQASMAERHVLQDAFGASEALASIISLHRRTPKECSDFFAAYRGANTLYTMVGFIQHNGLMACSSTHEVHDFSDNLAFQQAIAEPFRRTQTLGRFSGDHRHVDPLGRFRHHQRTRIGGNAFGADDIQPQRRNHYNRTRHGQCSKRTAGGCGPVCIHGSEIGSLSG